MIDRNNKRYLAFFKSIRLIDFVIIGYISTIFLFTDDTSTLYISNIVFLILLVMVGFRCLSTRGGKLSIRNIKQYFPILVFSVISIPIAISPSLALSRSVTMISLLVLVVLINNCYNDNDGNPNVLLLAMLIGGAVVAYSIIREYGFQNVLLNIINGRRLGGEVLQLNYLGRYTYLSTIIGFYFGYVKKLKLFYIIAVVSAVVCVASQSRQALISLIVSATLLYLLHGYEKKKIYNILKVLLVIFVIILFLQLPQLEAVRDRLWAGLTAVDNTSASSESDEKRIYMIKFGLKVFASSPIWGIGLGNVKNVVTGIISTYKYLHNNYVELLATGGLCGFCSFYSIYYLFVKKYKKIRLEYRSSELIFAFVLLVGQLILDMFAVQYYSKVQYLIFAYAFIVLSRNLEFTN